MIKRKKIDSRAVKVVRAVDVPLKGRTVERQRGCWNCVAWNNAEIASKHYAQTRKNDEIALVSRGMQPGAVNNRLLMQDMAMRPPLTGVCIAGGAQAEFTFPAHLCHKWTGRVKVEGKVDALADELWDRLDEKLEEKPGGGKL